LANTDITIAQFKTELAAVKTAIRARDWSTAHTELACAEITLSGIEKQLSDNGASVQYRDMLDGARKALEAAKTGTAQSSTNNRIVYARNTYGRG
jgi:hypothetical protein